MRNHTTLTHDGSRQHQRLYHVTTPTNKPISSSLQSHQQNQQNQWSAPWPSQTVCWPGWHQKTTAAPSTVRKRSYYVSLSANNSDCESLLNFESCVQVTSLRAAALEDATGWRSTRVCWSRSSPPPWRTSTRDANTPSVSPLTTKQDSELLELKVTSSSLLIQSVSFCCGWFLEAGFVWFFVPS